MSYDMSRLTTYKQVMTGQGSVSQAITGTIALGFVYDSLNSPVPFADANVHVDAVVFKEEHAHTYISRA